MAEEFITKATKKRIARKDVDSVWSGSADQQLAEQKKRAVENGASSGAATPPVARANGVGRASSDIPSTVAGGDVDSPQLRRVRSVVMPKAVPEEDVLTVPSRSQSAAPTRPDQRKKEMRRIKSMVIRKEDLEDLVPTTQPTSNSSSSGGVFMRSLKRLSMVVKSDTDQAASPKEDEVSKSKKRQKKIQQEKERRRKQYRSTRKKEKEKEKEKEKDIREHMARRAALAIESSSGSSRMNMLTHETMTHGGGTEKVERVYRLNSAVRSVTHTSAVSKGRTPRDNPAAMTRRYRIIRELRDTERSYVTNLQTAVLVFVVKLRSVAGTSNEIVPEQEINKIFGNLEEVVQFNRLVLQELEIRTNVATWTDESLIGDYFVHLVKESDMPRIYLEYVNGYESALPFIREKFKSGKATPFTNFIRDGEGTTFCGNHSLSSFLVAPVQRIPRYMLLMRDLLKHTEKSHPDHDNIECALKGLTDLASELNEAKSAADEKQKMLSLLANFTREDQAKLVGDHYLIAHGPIDEMLENGEHRPRDLLVFNDTIACCKPGRDGLKIIWTMELMNTQISEFTMTDGLARFRLVELRRTFVPPYCDEVTVMLLPHKNPPNDVVFWRRSFEAALATFWLDHRPRLLQNASHLVRHMQENVMSSRDWRLICMLGEKVVLSQGEALYNMGDTFNGFFYYVEQGSLSVHLTRVSSHAPVVMNLRNGECLNQVALLESESGTPFEEILMPWSVYGAANLTVAIAVPVTKLLRFLALNPDIAARFYQLQTYMLGFHLTFIRLHQNIDDQDNWKLDSSEMLVEVEQSAPIEHRTEFEKAQAALKKLPVPSSELVLYEFECKVKGKSGTLIISDTYCCFCSKSVSKKSAVVMNKHHIASLKVVREGLLVIVTTDADEALEIQVSDHEQVNDVYHAIRGLCATALDGSKARKIGDSKDLNVADVIPVEYAMSPVDWSSVFKCTSDLRIDRNVAVIKQGETQQRLYYIESGSIRVEYQESDLDDPVVLVENYGKGLFFGELSYLQGGIASATIVTNEETNLKVFRRSRLHRLFRCNHRISACFHRVLSMECLLPKVLASQRRTFDVGGSETADSNADGTLDGSLEGSAGTVEAAATSTPVENGAAGHESGGGAAEGSDEEW